MELPNKANAFVSIRKVSEYLISETHAVGKSKAKYFRSLGFNEQNVGQFQQGLIRLAQEEYVTEVGETIYGKKYIVDGNLETPRGDMIRLRTVWIIETGDSVPRLVTAYPLD